MFRRLANLLTGPIMIYSPLSNVSGAKQSLTKCRTVAPPLTLILRENGQPPMVAKIPSEMITLAKFRRTFGVSRTENKRYAVILSNLFPVTDSSPFRFLFKSTCEDESAPFQWSLITDDDAVLPLFDGKITAECRHFNDSD
ncbi:hypothetical protein ANCCEY_03225 [Ancylostoma ceylanicum]|uniref:DIX domain-containing protein n=1 Tax=Ancylostoma ceylanicum TaxID=53326 RepID=A0A0D6M5M8_9BILA|nr:hypothetical protein ANCCEY_03225 [Ancylostoma ceylanicum]